MSYNSWLEYLEPEIMGNDDTLNSTCPQCQRPLAYLTGCVIDNKVAITLECPEGHETVKVLPVSRFVKVPLAQKESTLGNRN